jgi:hypothetical protein
MCHFSNDRESIKDLRQAGMKTETDGYVVILTATNTNTTTNTNAAVLAVIGVDFACVDGT